MLDAAVVGAPDAPMPPMRPPPPAVPTRPRTGSGPWQPSPSWCTPNARRPRPSPAGHPVARERGPPGGAGLGRVAARATPARRRARRRRPIPGSRCAVPVGARRLRRPGGEPRGDGTMLRTRGARLGPGHPGPRGELRSPRVPHRGRARRPRGWRSERFLSEDYGVEERITLEVTLHRGGTDTADADRARSRAQRSRGGEDRPGPHHPRGGLDRGAPLRHLRRRRAAGRHAHGLDGLQPLRPRAHPQPRPPGRGAHAGVPAHALRPPLVLEPEQWVRLELSAPRRACSCLDGQSAELLEPGDSVVCRVGPCTGAPRHLRPEGLLLDPPRPGSTWPTAEHCWSSCACGTSVSIESVAIDLGPGMTAADRGDRRRQDLARRRPRAARGRARRPESGASRGERGVGRRPVHAR